MFHFNMDIEPNLEKLKKELEQLQKRITKAYKEFWKKMFKYNG